MTAIAPDTLVLNWLLGLPFFAAICVELFPRLSLRPHSEGEAEAMKSGPFYLGGLVCVMGLGLTICLFPLTLAGRPVGADYWWTRDLYHLRFQADALSTLVVLALYGLGLLIQLHLGGQPNTEAANHRAALLLVGMGCGVLAALSADLILLVFSLEAALLSFWLLASLEAPGDCLGAAEDESHVRLAVLGQRCGHANQYCVNAFKASHIRGGLEASAVDHIADLSVWNVLDYAAS